MQSFCLLLFEGSGLLSNLGGWIASAPVNIEPDHQANRKSPLYVSCMLFTVSCLTSTCSSGPLLSLLLVLCFLIILVWGVVLFTFCRKTYLTFTFAVQWYSVDERGARSSNCYEISLVWILYGLKDFLLDFNLFKLSPPLPSCFLSSHNINKDKTISYGVPISLMFKGALHGKPVVN